MRKNFFKKLSFVLALAMIISVIAPAAGAFAASAPKLNATKKYLHLDKDGSSEFDFNIKNKQTGWKYLWSSANEAVATVESNGVVTATGVGTTKVSVVISEDGEEVDELSATVSVRDNIASLTITNTPAGNKLAVGVANDFNRAFVTGSGSTTKTSGVTRWAVDKDGATISDGGVFTATKAGVYKVTANAFQSKSKYASWLVDSTKYASYVTATAEYTVTVNVSMVSAKQVDLNTFTVTFDTAVTDAKAKLSVGYLVGTTEVATVIKEVSMNADNTVATVDFYTNFVEGATYIAKYPDLTSVQFVAAKSEVANVKSLQVTTTKVEINEPSTVEVALLNADGVNIADADLLLRVTMDTSSASTYLAGRVLSMYTVGATTTISATFHTYNYDTATGTETGNVTGSGVVTCVDQIVDTVSKINAYTVTNSYDSFKTINHSVAVDDASYKLYVQLLMDDDADSDYYINNNTIATVGTTGFEMTSSNTGILIVDNSGNVFPVSAGSASVIVEYQDKVVGAVVITVGARREVSTVTLDNYSFVLSNDDDTADNKVVAVTVKDQFGTNLDASKYNVNILQTNTVSTTNNVGRTGDVAKSGMWDAQKYKFTGTNAAEGTNVYKITVQDTTSWKSMYAYVTVNVQAPSSDDSSYSYRIETNSSSYNMNLNEWAWDNSENVTVSLFGYAADGIRNQRINLTETNLNINDNADWYAPVITATGSALVISLTNGTAEIAKAPTGTWVLQATSGTAIIATSTFTVTDTQDAPTVAVNKLVVDLTATTGDVAVTEAVKACFTFTVNGDDVTSTIQSLTAAEYTGANGVYFIKNVYYRELLSGGGAGRYILHKVSVNRTITIQ